MQPRWNFSPQREVQLHLPQLLLAVLLFIAFSVMMTNTILTQGNINAILSANTIPAILALGAMIPIATGKSGANVEGASALGGIVGKKALEKGITEIVFDRGGNLYHGRVKALADGAREAGLKF